MAFEVIGDVEHDGGQVSGYAQAILGEILGAAARGALAKAGHQAVSIKQAPGWRDGQWAPGVNAPQEGQVPLQLTPQTNNGIFTATIPQIDWIGRMQKPYRAERLVVELSPVGSSAASITTLLGQIFVGVDLQQGTTQRVSLTGLGSLTAFGVRMTLAQAPPGVEIALSGVSPPPGIVLSGSDTLFASFFFLGRVIH